MDNTTLPKHSAVFDMTELNRHATVRYRRTPEDPGRVFLANSFKSADALVAYVSEEHIGLIIGMDLKPSTLLRIEMGNGGNAIYVDLAATITQTEQLENGKWRCDCEWVRKLTREELILSRYRAFDIPLRKPENASEAINGIPNV